MAVSYAFERKADQGAEFYRQASDLESPARRRRQLKRPMPSDASTSSPATRSRRGVGTRPATRRRAADADEPAWQLDLSRFRWLHAQARVRGTRRPWSRRTPYEAGRGAGACREVTVAAGSGHGPRVSRTGYVELSPATRRPRSRRSPAPTSRNPFVVMLEARATEKTAIRRRRRSSGAQW